MEEVLEDQKMEEVLEDQKKPILPKSLIDYILEYVDKDFGNIIFKNDNKKKLSVYLIMNSGLEYYFKDMLKGKFKNSLCRLAATKGYVTTLEWANKNGFELYPSLFAKAASNGHLNCLKFLKDHVFERPTEVCSSAALYGHLHCLQYAHENGFSMNGVTIENAIYEKHKDCLDYARKNGCPEPDFLYS
jgi:hypothetical protein